MDFLLREDAPFAGEQWQAIDEMVIKTARNLLVGRRFIPMYGPLGAGVQSIHIDEYSDLGQGENSFFGDKETEVVKAKARRFVEIPLIYKDFSIPWRDVEYSRQMKLPLDIAPAAGAAAICARKEDELIFLGDEASGSAGLINANGATYMQKKNWQDGENPFSDVAAGIEKLSTQGFVGSMALAVSPDLYLQMQRIQAGMGMMELDRVKQLVEGKLYKTPVLGANKAVLVCAQPQNLDVVVGQDMITGYLGPEKLNHSFRVLETILLRIKRADSIVVFS